MVNNMSGEAHRPGRIEVVCGSMFSGKTEELIRRLKRAEFARQKVEIFKPAIDTRYSDIEVVSHDRHSIPSTPVETSSSILLLSSDIEVVGIDEAQFFDEGLVAVCNELANRGVRVIVAGLDMDFKGVPFGPIPALCAIADEVTKDEGARHLRKMRRFGIREPPACGQRQAGDARRAERIRAALPRMLPQGGRGGGGERLRLTGRRRMAAL